MDRSDRLKGLILGTAAGHALGLPYEGLSRRRIAASCPGRWRHRRLLGRGFVSDDTDHTLLVGRALLRAPRDVAHFKARLAGGLRWCLLGLPVGAGRATYLSTLRLWIGYSPARSGIFSAGNGPAMRSALIGAVLADDEARRNAYLEVQTRVTHSDPRALTGARAIADIAALVVREDLTERPHSDAVDAVLRAAGEGDEEWAGLRAAIREAAADHISVAEFADRIGLSKGVSGYMYHTVPVAIYSWYAHFGDVEATVDATLRCGGDTDTVGAIAGALAGVTTGERGIPADWIDGLLAWPYGVRYMRALAERLSRESEAPPPRALWPALPVRNVTGNVSAAIYLLRQLLPPYG
jgi:ADP-ribosylglycohydrolase